MWKICGVATIRFNVGAARCILLWKTFRMTATTMTRIVLRHIRVEASACLQNILSILCFNRTLCLADVLLI